MMVSFRIRREYFDAIVSGEKTREVRRDSDYWRKRASNLLRDEVHGVKSTAVFVCGKDVHRRRVIGVGWCDTPEEALGRVPSAQGREDLGYGPVVYFDLGEALHVA